MPLPFEDFQGRGAFDFYSSSDLLLLQQLQKQKEEQNWLLNYRNRESSTAEPTSVLDNLRSPSPPTLSSTLSSSLGGGSNGGSGGCGSSTTDTTAKNVSGSGSGSGKPPSILEKCGGLGMEDWEGVLSGSPNQEQSILRLIMGDIDDPSLGLNKNLPQYMEFNAGFGLVDQACFGFETPFTSSNTLVSSSIDSDFGNNASLGSVSDQGHVLTSAAANHLPPSVLQPQPFEPLDEKPQILNSQLIINQNQAQYAQNPASFLPLSYAQMQHQLLSPAPPPPKRLNLGTNQNQKVPFPDLGQQELFLRRQQQQLLQMLQQRQTMGVTATSTNQNMINDERANHQLQQAIIDQIFKASELIETGNSVLAQGILARLNHQLSPIGKPFQRAAFYFRDALQLLLHMNINNSSAALTGYSIISKISAYKSFSEISPILQFANFTCNQALLEAFDGFKRIHIIDFDIGYGGQWASLMQELVLRREGPPLLKITAFASPSTHDELELGFTQENLKHFASEVNIPFEIEILSLEALNSGSWPLPLRELENDVTAVNLPIGTFSNYPATFPLVLRFVKQLSPKIVVSLDRGCDRTDIPFPHHMIHALQSYSGILESLDAVNVNSDALQKIERFLIYPSIEKIVLGRHRSPERLSPWKSLFMQSGFAPLTFSNFTESQADCLVQRTPVKGFHVEKRQSSLVLCWQQKELISATAWRC